jgi:hypothetical protein
MKKALVARSLRPSSDRGRPDLADGKGQGRAKVGWAIVSIVPLVPFVYLLTGNDIL